MLISSIGVIALLLSMSAQAQSGKITFISGNVETGKNESLKKATLDQVVNPGDTVKTGNDAVAIVPTDDQTQMKLKSNTEITLSTSNKEEVALNSGGLFASVQKQQQKHFYIKTKSATMGVRGTKFFTAYGKAGKNGQDVWMCVDEGVVAVESPTEAEPVLVKAGFGVFVPSGKKVTEPKPYEWTKGLNWNMDPKQGEVVDKSNLESGYKDLLKQNYD